MLAADFEEEATRLEKEAANSDDLKRPGRLGSSGPLYRAVGPAPQEVSKPPRRESRSANNKCKDIRILPKVRKGAFAKYTIALG